MSAAAYLRWLEYANIAATLVVVWRLLDQKLQQAYRWFFVYLVYDVADSLTGLIPLHDRASVYRYIAVQGTQTILAIFVVFEIYRLALAERKALARFSRNFVTLAILVSVVLSVMTLLLQGPTIKFLPLRVMLVAEGFLDSTQLLLLLLMAAFLAWFPLDIRKNLAVYIAGFAVYFTSRWVVVFLVVRRIAYSEWVNVISFAITLLCMGSWIGAMRNAGERETTITGHRWNPAEMDRLKGQLDEINASLERLAR
jgi:hypothetical protein